MIFEIKVQGARQVGKTTILNKIINLLEKEAADTRWEPSIEFIQRIKSYTENGIPTETVIVKISTFAERVAKSYAWERREYLGKEIFEKEFLNPLEKTT